MEQSAPLLNNFNRKHISRLCQLRYRITTTKQDVYTFTPSFTNHILSRNKQPPHTHLNNYYNEVSCLLYTHKSSKLLKREGCSHVIYQCHILVSGVSHHSETFIIPTSLSISHKSQRRCRDLDSSKWGSTKRNSEIILLTVQILFRTTYERFVEDHYFQFLIKHVYSDPYLVQR